MAAERDSAGLEELGRPDGDPEFEAAFDRMVALKHAIAHENSPTGRLCCTLDNIAGLRRQRAEPEIIDFGEPEIVGFGEPDPR